MSGKCKARSELKLFQLNFESRVGSDEIMSELSWYQWESTDGRMVKVERIGNMDRLSVQQKSRYQGS